MKNKFLKKNISLFIPIIILLVLSLLNMYGASFISPLYSNALKRQIMWIIVGLIIFLVIYKIDMRFFYKYSFIFYITGVLLLILVLFIGKSVNGARSWFRIGALSIQPSEFIKFPYLLYLSRVINKHNGGSITLLLKILLITFIPCILIFLEPDTGVVIMYLLIMLGCIFASRVKRGYTISIMSIFIISLASLFGLYFFKKDLFIEIFGTSFFYRMDRILAFKNNSSYQLTNALIGIGSSGAFGLGLTSPKIYVPEVITDFVFDLTIMNFGYVVGIMVVFIYMFILFKIYNLSIKDKKYYHRCLLSGIFWMMLFQVFEHIMMNVGLTPITGITLPFLSYGGSSLVSYAALFALISKITTNSSSYN